MRHGEFLQATAELRFAIKKRCSRSKAVVITHGDFVNFLAYGSFHLPCTPNCWACDESGHGTASIYYAARKMQGFFKRRPQGVAQCFPCWNPAHGWKLSVLSLGWRLQGFWWCGGMLINPVIDGRISCVKDHHKSLPREKQITGWTRQLSVPTAEVWLPEAILDLCFCHPCECVANNTEWLRKLLHPYENATAKLSYVLINCWLWLLLFNYFTAQGFSKLPFGELRAAVKHIAWRISSFYVNVLVVFLMNTLYHGVYFHFRVSCEIMNCWECAWDVVGWEGPLSFVGEEHGGSKDQAKQTHRRGIRAFPTQPGLPVLALQLSLMIYFRSMPAGGDKWLWVICVLNITSRIRRECHFSWVIDWLVTSMSCNAQLVHRFEQSCLYMCCQESISKNLVILSFSLQSAIQLKILTWQKKWSIYWGFLVSSGILRIN